MKLFLPLSLYKFFFKTVDSLEKKFLYKHTVTYSGPTKTQHSWGQTATLEMPNSKALLREASATASCWGLHQTRFWIPTKSETPQLLWQPVPLLDHPQSKKKKKKILMLTWNFLYERASQIYTFFFLICLKFLFFLFQVFSSWHIHRNSECNTCVSLCLYLKNKKSLPQLFR